MVMMLIDLSSLIFVLVCLCSLSSTEAISRILVMKSSQPIYDSSPKLHFKGRGFDHHDTTRYVTKLRLITQSSTKAEIISNFVDERYQVINDVGGLTLKLNGNHK